MLKLIKNVRKPNRPIEYALKLLGQRPYSKKRLSEKLYQRGIKAEEVDKVIIRLEQLGFIDDLNFSRNFVESSQKVKLNGRRKIYWQLIKKGIPGNIAEKAISEAYDSKEEEEAVRKLVSKFSKNIPKEKMYERLMRRLISKGYSLELARREVKKEIDYQSKI